MDYNQSYILEILNDLEVIDHESEDLIRNTALTEGCTIPQAIEKLEILSEQDLLYIIASEYGMETISLTDYAIPEDALAMLCKKEAVKFHTVPVFLEEGHLKIAISNPSDNSVIDAVSHNLGIDVTAVVANYEDIEQSIHRHYFRDLGASTIAEQVTPLARGESSASIDIEEQLSVKGIETGMSQGEDETPVIKMATSIIVKAIEKKASDIHIEPMQDTLHIRFRIDGVMHKMPSPPMELKNSLIGRYKVVANMDIAQKRLPQDGRINIEADGKVYDLRVSSIPSTHGESLVMRLLDKSSVLLGINDLGMTGDDQKKVEEIIHYPDGIFLVTGPTGSGKTTSLYSFLNTLNTPGRKIITAEDPVEYELKGINQVQVNKTVGLTFASILRSMLRQAPNVIMVGEIRDVETCKVAINAALTGHLVFSTLHTNDAPTAVARLQDIGAKNYLISSAVRAVMAQRLVRKICSNCSEPYQPTNQEMRLLDLLVEDKKRILVVDDDRSCVKLTCRILEKGGIKTVTASDGYGALKILRQDTEATIDMIITDINMPGLSGDALVEIINEEFPYLPVIVASGAKEEVLEGLSKINIHGFLHKPINGKKLQGIVKSVYKNRLNLSKTFTSEDVQNRANWRKGAGCDKCQGTGYKGRMGIYEVMKVDKEVRNLILKNTPTAQLRKKARERGMMTLRDDALGKAIQGLTTIDEVICMTVSEEN